MGGRRIRALLASLKDDYGFRILEAVSYADGLANVLSVRPGRVCVMALCKCACVFVCDGCAHAREPRYNWSINRSTDKVNRSSWPPLTTTITTGRQHLPPPGGLDAGEKQHGFAPAGDGPAGQDARPQRQGKRVDVGWWMWTDGSYCGAVGSAFPMERIGRLCRACVLC